MNGHLLKECIKKDTYKQCKRCKESISTEHYEQHTAKKACAPWKPLAQANRCPLCHKDIPPGDKGWRTHLMTKKCVANERNHPQPLTLIESLPEESKVASMVSPKAVA